MILRQLYLQCLAQASYLIGDERSGQAAVVDPRRDVDEILAEARRLGLEIRHVLLTHFHADFVAGHLELARRTGARIALGARARAEYDFRPLREGERIELGDVRLEILETPGHTPESISILVFDLARDREKPQAVLTGDTLFVGDVGRPDLLASVGVTARELAGELYRSLHRKLLALPDETVVWPAHGAGSMCGKNLGKETSTTIGEQRRSNYALQPMDEETFVRLVTTDQPEAPGYFGHDARLNREERPVLEESLARELVALPLERVLALQARGARVLDVREAGEFAAAHLPGSVNVGLSGRFATWAGTVLGPEEPLVVVAPPGKEREAVMRLGRIGFERVEGYLEDGMQALVSRPELVERTVRIAPAELARRLAGPDAPTVIDVRTPGEWSEGHVAGSLNVPLNELGHRLDELPEGSLAVVCRSGYRSSLAASLIAATGRKALFDVAGGMEAWTAAELATSAPA
jgi:glyoxylase-like metal-dependent hydrolase (beta-lactamase superfamily II)/rhodanese-related sulfurtransferase